VRTISLTLEAEVMLDADTGIPSLVAAARTQLAEFERLADEQEARDTLAALLVEYGIELEEWDTASLDPKLREAFDAFGMLPEGGPRLVVVPVGQDPIDRLAAVRKLIGYLDGAA